MIRYKGHLLPKALPTISNPSASSLPTTSNSSNEPKSKESSTQTKYSTVNIISAVTVKNADMKSESVQTTEALSSDTPRKRKLEKKLKESKHKQRRLQNELDKIKNEVQSKDSKLFERFTFQTEDEVTKRFCRLIKWQSSLNNRCKGNRYDPEFKLFALNLHFSSPQTYRSLKTFLSLPSESTLHRFKMIIPPVIEDRTLEFLSAKLKSMPDNARHCTLCIDEMVIKRHLHYDTRRDEMIGLHNINGEVTPEIASHACVAMLRGIIVNWKQPIAYSFLGSPKHYERLELWLDEIILKLSNIGIEVKAIVSDQGSNFDKYAKQVKNISKEKPYFLLNGKKIYYIFDAPHLIKCIRNNLLTNDFLYDDKKISWHYIKELFSKQQVNNLKLIPKITEAHIQPNNFQKMRVKYAAQIFSHSVYAALSVLIHQNTLPEEARATADFVQKMNNIFDVLNSSSVRSTYKFRRAFSFKKYQLEVLEDAITTFSHLKAIDSKKGANNTNRIKTFKNLQITIQSILMLCKDLKEEGFNNVFTRRLNQDCLENFFGTVRQQGGNCQDPTAIQFQRAFSKLFLSNMLKNSPNTNCEEDVCELLQKHNDFLERPTPKDLIHRTVPSPVALNGETDYRFDLPTENALVYISGYLLFKCCKKHMCEDLTSELKKQPSIDESRMFIHFKAFNKTSSFYGNLKVQSDSFYDYVKNLETIFINNFEQNLNQKPGGTIYDLLKKHPFPAPCPCFPLEYLLKLFVRFRIFSTIKFNNREFRQGKKLINHYIKLKHV